MSELIYDLRAFDGAVLLVAKGHHSIEDFCDGAHNVYGGIEVEPGDVSHAYARWIPVWGDDWDENNKYHRDFLGHYLDYPVAPKRGAFMITYAERFVCPELEEWT